MKTKALVIVIALVTFGTVLPTISQAGAAHKTKEEMYSHAKRELHTAEVIFRGKLNAVNKEINADANAAEKKRGWITYVSAEGALAKAIAKIKFPSSDSHDVKALISALSSDESATQQLILNVNSTTALNLANQTYSAMKGAWAVLDTDLGLSN